MYFNAGEIIAFSNVHTKSPLKLDGEKQTKLGIVWS